MNSVAVALSDVRVSHDTRHEPRRSSWRYSRSIRADRGSGLRTRRQSSNAS